MLASKRHISTTHRHIITSYYIPMVQQKHGYPKLFEQKYTFFRVSFSLRFDHILYMYINLQIQQDDGLACSNFYQQHCCKFSFSYTSGAAPKSIISRLAKKHFREQHNKHNFRRLCYLHSGCLLFLVCVI